MIIEPGYSVSLEEQPAPDDVRLVHAGLSAYNRLYAPHDNCRPLALFLRDPGHTLVGGLLGETYWSWLHVSILWIHENMRRQGYGAKLLGRAGQEAIQRGCHSAHLDTLSFQTPSFYGRQGYTVFGVLPDHPIGHARHFLKKTSPRFGLNYSGQKSKLRFIIKAKLTKTWMLK